jgi:hypothetical protein
MCSDFVPDLAGLTAAAPHMTIHTENNAGHGAGRLGQLYRV